MKYPTIYKLENLAALAEGNVSSSVDGKTWVPTRPIGYPSWRTRLKAAWLVLTGRADAVVWPQGQ
jgi:hypothetical protein